MPVESTDVPDLIPVPGTIRTPQPERTITPWTPNWWQTSLIADIPETSVGWLVAQGWQIIGAETEDDGPTYYTLSRQSMQSWVILQSLLAEYVQKYNAANAANEMRYDDVIDLWNNTISYSRDQMDAQGNQSDAHLTIYLGNMETLVASVESEMATALTSATDAGAIVAAQLAAYLVTLGTLEGIYDTHEAVAEAFLVDLGVTELARINAKWDSVLAKNLQSLVDRGLYSSAIVTAITSSVEGDRSEEISALNDRLAREQLDNEHKLYEQEMQVKGMVLDGKLKHSSAQHQQGQFLVEVRTKCALTIMQARLQRLQGRMEVRDREDKLMAYQLDTRNQLIVGLFGFIERREDEGPNIGDMTRLVVGLGDASGGWLSPD